MTVTGTDPALEMMADEMLAEYRRDYVRRYGVNTMESKQYILSPDQLEMRQSREVYNVNGVPDPAIRQGIYHRAYNPLMGKRPGKWWNQVDAPRWDNRVPYGSGTPTAAATPHWPISSPCWKISAPQGFYWHLTAGQRSRIRRLYRQVGSGRPREVLKDYLSDFYGVPPWVISRVAITSRNCHT